MEPLITERSQFSQVSELSTSSNRRKKKHSEVDKKEGGKSKVDELLERTLQNIASLETATINVPSERLKLTLEYKSNNKLIGGGDSDGENSSYYGSPRRKGLNQHDLASDRSLRSLGSVMNTKRSIGDNYSLGTEHSLSSGRLLTNRELLLEIKERAKRGRAPPDYVAPLHELDPSFISWNKKVPKSQRSKDDPSVNIIGCLHPIELVLAKADKRMRKQEDALKLKQQKCEERVKEIDDAIKWKFSRAERYAAALALKQFQYQWLRIIHICRFMGNLAPRFRNSFHSEKEFMKITRCLAVVKRFLIWWYRKHVFQKFQATYKKAFAKIESTLKLRVRIIRKRRSTNRIKQFLIDHKGHHKMTVIVHRYLQSVRKVQAMIRSYITCKNAKVEAMEKIWNKQEVQYIRRKLEQKRARMRDLHAAKRSSDQQFSEISSRMFSEMKQQAKVWSKIDNRMELMVNTLKLTGVIQEETEEEIIARLVVPEQMRKTSLKQYLEKVRKEFYVTQRNALRKQIELDATFKEHHAAQLLRGQTDNLHRIINDRYGKKVMQLKYKPFYFFTLLDRKHIYDRVKESHNIQETFKIKIDKFN